MSQTGWIGGQELATRLLFIFSQCSRLVEYHRNVRPSELHEDASGQADLIIEGSLALQNKEDAAAGRLEGEEKNEGEVGTEDIEEEDGAGRPFCQAAIMMMCTLLAGSVGGSLSLVVDGSTISTAPNSLPVKIPRKKKAN